MTEIPKRFTKDEVYRTEIGPDDYATGTWVDIPGVLNETQILGQWRLVGPELVREGVYKRVIAASDALQTGSSDADVQNPSFVTGADRLMKELEVLGKDTKFTPIIEQLRELVGNGIELDWIKLQKRAEYLGRVARGRTPLYAAGWELWTDNRAMRAPGFAGKLKDIVPIRKEEVISLEPVVEGIDGSAGLFPRGVGFQGLYATRLIDSGDKKFRMGREDEITDDERAEAAAAYEAEEAEYRLQKSV